MTENDLIIQGLRRENEGLRAELAQRNEMRWISKVSHWMVLLEPPEEE